MAFIAESISHLLVHYGSTASPAAFAGANNGKDVDRLDALAGIDTTGGKYLHGGRIRYRNTLGERVALHSQKARRTVRRPPQTFFHWLGAEG